MTQVWSVLIVLVVILGSVILHELMRGLVAYWLGDNTAKDSGRLMLNPLKHIDPFMSVLLPLLLYVAGGPVFGGAKPVPVNHYRLKGGPWGMALVAIAGPLTNFLIALISFLVGYYTGWLMSGGIADEILTNLIVINLGFMVFNLLPIPPLDGSRVLYAIAPDGVRAGMERLERTGGMMLVLVLVVFFSTALSKIMSGAILMILQFFYFLVGGQML